MRKIFIDEPGVLCIGSPSRLMRKASQTKYVRRYGLLRIPESVFVLVRDRLTAKRPALEPYRPHALRAG